MSKGGWIGGRWYGWLEDKLAPTEPIANMVLVALLVVTLVILIQPSRTLKAAWIAYWVSP